MSGPHSSTAPPQTAIAKSGTAPVVLSDAEVERIQAAAESAQAPATRRRYGSAWRGFTSWCEERGHASLPAEPIAVAAYLAERAQTIKPATIAVIAAAIGYHHRARNLANPVDAQGVKLVLAGLARQGQAGQQRQAKGISLQDLAAIRATARQPRTGRGGRMESGMHARDRGILDVALCSVMFDGMLRRSEAAELRWHDIRRDADKSGRLTVRRSKTDQTGQGKVLWLSPTTMFALAELAAIRPDDEPGDHVFGLSAAQICQRIAAACEAAGLGPGYSGHSLRVGAAQALAAANISLAAIMENGRWQSSMMPARYTRHANAAQSAMARLYARG